MILETKAATCTKCGSTNLRRNGKTGGGKQKYACKDCGAYGSVNPTDRAYTEEEQAPILAAYQERASLRGVERVFGVARSTVARWLKKKKPASRRKKTSSSRG